MISEDYVSFEVSKLLKEKGFEQHKTKLAYNKKGELNWSDDLDPFEFSAPTHQMAMKWLREVHKLFIVIEPEYFEAGRVIAYDFSVWCGDNYKHYFKDYPTFEEAVEAALKYSLENLIQ